jgi:formylglycine-generating enzyme required for sulfatase activity/bifunctional DNA-binding transcriptional regulator/antitoxin component of YhaV-PrlF toxin-antitoxin module
MSDAETGNSRADGFFQTGGTLEADAPSYVERPADGELHRSILAGDYCYVLTPRQMGKSSLMTKTAARLHGEGVHVAVVDLSGIGGDAGSMKADQWYYGLANRLLRELKIPLALDDWWTGQTLLPPLDRLMIFFEDVILDTMQGRVVVFVDEIDTTINLPFSDDFFAAIRYCFNARANKAPFSRLSFVLLGVASPTELIRDAVRTPFNIGKRIDLADFNEQEASLFLRGFSDGEGNAERLLKRILYWTNGHPFLTQRLCVQVQSVDSCEKNSLSPRERVGVRGTHNGITSSSLSSHNAAETPEARVDRIVAAEFLGIGRRTENEHLKVINDRILQTGSKRPAVLKLYAKVLKRKPVQDQPQSLVHSALKLSGLVKTDGQGRLVVRNPIYRQVFDARWVKRLRPTRWKQNSVIVVLLASAIVFGWWIGAQQLTLRSGGSIALAWLGLAYPEPEMVEIPADSFRMGSPGDEEDRQADEGPLHTVNIKAFRLGKYEVTFDEYDVFAFLVNGDGGCADGHKVTWAQDQGWGRGRRPVINVSWQDANCFAEWLSRKTKKTYRLPTEAEWEYAARARTQTPRPWPGDLQAACHYANVYDQGSVAEINKRYSGFFNWMPFPCSDGYAFTAPVGSFKPSLFELHDMLGNVWEWVADCYHDSYQKAPTDGRSWDDGTDCVSGRRVVRGGSWYFEPGTLRSAFRDRQNPDKRLNYLGFRLAQDKMKASERGQVTIPLAIREPYALLPDTEVEFVDPPTKGLSSLAVEVIRRLSGEKTKLAPSVKVSGRSGK